MSKKATILTTRENKYYKNEIGFILYPEKIDGTEYKGDKNDSIFIPTDDFDYIIDIFKSFYPMSNPIYKDIDDSFDSCGYNYFEKKICFIIIDKIVEIYSENEKVKIFLNDLVDWLNNKLKYADIITVYGNL